ncbi:MAG: hypothetical protein ABR506_04395 [Candidatus Krumholzibacteriia bacterium]
MSARGRAAARAAAVAAALAALALAGGCGEKIAIPEAEGLFGFREYRVFQTLTEDDPRQLIQLQGAVFVLTADALVKRTTILEETGRAAGLADPTALCSGPGDSLIFVWEQGTRTVSWFQRSDLQRAGSTVLAEPVRVVAMAASTRGAGTAAGAESFLYLSDPDAGVVRRYAFDYYGGLTPYGLLARSDGASVRYVLEPAGLATDPQEHLLVCDADTSRNWVIRFDPAPDETDEDLRGVAALFDPVPRCAPVPAANEYALGNAPPCPPDEWFPGPSDSTGFFRAPQAVAVDGAGRIFVADTGNDRIQIFGADGTHDLTFGGAENSPGPTSIAVFDFRTGFDRTMHGALVYVVLPEQGRIRSFISSEYDESLNRPPRPPE